mmetsp:Transcript_29136/g.28194  ORF Transcript_29136/g.28194 Transcript_29136/m.28194 type:complete len:200 (-) Transcript_29136:2382-2981(-)
MFVTTASDQIDPPSVTQSGSNIVISWVPPYDNGATITAYKIEIRESDLATYSQETTYCDGSLSSIVSAASCSIPMSELWDSPFSLPYDADIIAIVSAYNSIGWNLASDPNSSGPTVQTVPVQMAQASRGSATSTTQIEVDWAALTSSSDTGGSAIVSYNLQWNTGSGATFYDLVGYTTDYTSTSFIVITGVSAGGTYDF